MNVIVIICRIKFGPKSDIHENFSQLESIAIKRVSELYTIIVHDIHFK